jgi:hypothetical protein
VLLRQLAAHGHNMDRIKQASPNNNSLLMRKLVMLERHGLQLNTLQTTLADLRDERISLQPPVSVPAGTTARRRTRSPSPPPTAEASGPSQPPKLLTRKKAARFIPPEAAEVYETKNFVLKKVLASRWVKKTTQHDSQLQHLCRWECRAMTLPMFTATNAQKRLRQFVKEENMPRKAPRGAVASAKNVAFEDHWCLLTDTIKHDHTPVWNHFNDTMRQLRPTPPAGCPPRAWPLSLPHVTLQTEEADPDSDICPPVEGTAVMSVRDEDALFHNAHGRFCGRTSVLNAQHLWRVSSCTDDWPTFCQQMCNLFLRYTDKMPSGVAGRKVRLKNNWATPRVLVSAFQAIFSTNCEKFASPLNVHPGTQHYWTLCAADTRLGASTDAYGHDWSCERGIAALVTLNTKTLSLPRLCSGALAQPSRTSRHVCLSTSCRAGSARRTTHSCAARTCARIASARFPAPQSSTSCAPATAHYLARHTLRTLR